MRTHVQEMYKFNKNKIKNKYHLDRDWSDPKLGLLMELLQLQKQLLNSDTRIIYKKKSSMKLPNLKLTCKPQNLKEKKKKKKKTAVVHHIPFQGNLLPMEPLPSPCRKLGV